MSEFVSEHSLRKDTWWITGSTLRSSSDSRLISVQDKGQNSAKTVNTAAFTKPELLIWWRVKEETVSLCSRSALRLALALPELIQTKVKERKRSVVEKKRQPRPLRVQIEANIERQRAGCNDNVFASPSLSRGNATFMREICVFYSCGETKPDLPQTFTPPRR
ncbi:unnamed protein product [Pleuronectes platessa]|uniref:Uncharacterized protein n=1 Tax=Pleuronectes platessa TaxID=8262 RepID=A0A9N7UUQ0_PLEPL|nr:unnamed protein product [Pleuronectes platessa]